MGGVSMEWKELQTLVKRKIGYGIVQPGPSVQKGVPIIKVNNIISGLCDTKHLDKTTVENDAKYQRTKLKGGELIVTVVGTCGKTAIVPPQFVGCNLVRATCLIDIEDETICRWIKYYIDSPQGQAYINRNLNTTVQATLNVKNLNEMPIPFYSKEYTSNVVKILSSLDRKIELNNKINADLEEMAQAIFKNWLSECSDDVTIGELSLNVTNYEKTDAEKVVLINSSDVTEGYFNHHNYSPNKNLKGHFKKRFQKGDILYSQVRPRNRHWAYCNFDANDYLASTQLMIIRNNPSLITSILLYQYIISDNVWKEFTLKTETRSGTFPQGNYEDLSQIRVPYNSDVEGISNQLETLYAKMFMLEKENSRLSLLRDTLLPRLMSGELEVPE